MKIIGQEKASFIDFPGYASTVYFTEGCNFNCHYCHNADIVNGMGVEISEKEMMQFLNKRRKFLDAVCISGGEPTLNENLYDLVKKIKTLDYKVKLDTNGTNPGILKVLVQEALVDYIAMDIKAPVEQYEKIIDTQFNPKMIEESIDFLMQNRVAYEFRTTVAKELLSAEDILKIAQRIGGAKLYCIQNYRGRKNILNPHKQMSPYEVDELEQIKSQIQHLLNAVKIR